MVSVATLDRRSIAVGLLGFGWTSVLQLIATPVLLSLLGPAAVGIVAFQLAVQNLSKVLDLGSSASIGRALARTSTSDGAAPALVDVFRRLQRANWIVAALIALVLWLSAANLAAHWNRGAVNGVPDLARVLTLVGILVGVQWPITLYEAVLSGMQRIPTLQAVGMVIRTAGTAGGLLLLYAGPRTLSTYLAVLIAAATAHVGLLAWLSGRALGRVSEPSKQSTFEHKTFVRFAGSMSILALLSAIVSHGDKLVVARMLSLEAFGYYSVANLLASGLYVLSLPVFHAALPILTRAASSGSAEPQRELFALSCHVLTALVAPVACVVALFAEPLILLWSGSADTAFAAAPVARLLAIGTGINCLMTIPYALQLAHGRPFIGVRLHVGMLAIYFPSLWLASETRGAVGAAGAWLGVNILYACVGIPYTNRVLGMRNTIDLVKSTILAPAAISIAVTGLAWWLVTPHAETVGFRVLAAAVSACLGWAAAFAASPPLRRWISPMLVHSRSTHPHSPNDQ